MGRRITTRVPLPETRAPAAVAVLAPFHESLPCATPVFINLIGGYRLYPARPTFFGSSSYGTGPKKQV